MKMQHRLRILHLSDLHARVELGWMKPERKALIRSNHAARMRVLGEPLMSALSEIRAEGAVDLLCFTGDLADWGLAQEYVKMADTLREICAALGLPMENVFPVPGNHDVNRGTAVGEWAQLRKRVANRSDVRQQLGAWLAGAVVPSDVLPELPKQVLTRQDGYQQWLKDTLKRPELLPGANDDNHPRLGYRAKHKIDRLPFPIHIIGLNTAWLAGDDHDSGNLALTLEQVDWLCHVDGRSLPGFRLALMHHALADLAQFDQIAVKPVLARQVDLLLHGHLHVPDLESLTNPDHTLRTLVAGSLYGDHGDRSINSFHVIDAWLNDSGQPQGYDITFHAWSPNGHWHRTSAFYRDAKDGCLAWPVAEGWRSPLQSPAAAPVRNHESLTYAPALCVARENELNLLNAALCGDKRQPVAVISLHGMAGVGKTRLVEHFFRQHPARFSQYLSLALRTDSPADQAALFATVWGQAGLKGAPNTDGLREHLSSTKTLLHIENVDSGPLAAAVAEMVAPLMPAFIIISGRYDGFSADSRWAVLPLKPFGEAGGLAQLTEELTTEVASAVDAGARRALVLALGGLPLALHIAASYLNKGHSGAAFLAQLRARGGDLGAHDVNDRSYASRSAGTLKATFEISRALFAASERGAGHGDPGWLGQLAAMPRAGFGKSQAAALLDLSEEAAEIRLHAALDYGLLERRVGTPGWTLHALIAEYLAGTGDSAQGAQSQARVDQWFLDRMNHPDAHPDAPQARAVLEAERSGMVEWLQSGGVRHATSLARSGFDTAMMIGPYNVWLGIVDTALAAEQAPLERSRLHWRKAQLARRGGELDAALAAATDARAAAVRCGDDGARDVALAAGVCADILEARGELDEALRIRKEEALPVYEKLGDVRSRAVTMGKIADILQARGELDEALRIRTKEQLPVYEKLGDVRSRLITEAKLGQMYVARGDLTQARVLWRHALADAQRMRIPEAQIIEQWLAGLADK